MTNDELLLAISNMMDIKFEAMTAAMDSKFGVIDKKFEAIDRKFEAIDRKFEAIDRRFDTIDRRFESIDRRFDTIEKDIKDIKFTLENQIEPRLQNIEDCYLSTFERYQAGVEQIDSMQIDIKILKQVVEGHSKELDKLA